MVNQQEKNAIEFVKDWAVEKGIKVQSKQRDGVGYDYEFIYPDGKVEKIEVKGTKKEYKIPDMSKREFQNKILVADFLFIVGNVLTKNKILYKIPRECIKSENLVLKETYHIRKFQNKKTMKKYIIK